MKKTLLIAVALGFAVVGTAHAQLDSTTGSFNQQAGEGITGSKHDLSTLTGVGANYGATDTLDRICIWCHAPHHALQTTDDRAGGSLYLPLWNHEVTAMSYTLYESDFGEGPDPSGLTGVGDATSDNQFADRHLFNGRDTIDQPGSVSKLCLGCHDGSVAVNNYGTPRQRANSQGAADAFIAPQFMIGELGNLVNHHPIGFSYLDVAAMDDEIADPDTPINGTTGSETTTIGSLLYGGGNMECVTCHDVHNSKNNGETFLWISDRNSKFCLTCHLK